LLLVEDKGIFDDLWNKAEFHLPAAEKTSHPLPVATILMMMTLEQQKTIQQLEHRTKTQAEKIERLEKAREKSERQVTYLKNQVESLEDQIEKRLSEFREEMLSIKYGEYEYVP
jgi:tRNA U34 5-carboxymethylaminomethyl modifying GTPase MnmE/TrmE